MDVPEILLNGHHEKIKKWRLLQSIKKTLQNRPDMINKDKYHAEIREIIDRNKGE